MTLGANPQIQNPGGVVNIARRRIADSPADKAGQTKAAPDPGGREGIDTLPTLAVDSLSVAYATPRGRLLAVNDVSLHIQPGEVLGLVGESGCGKSTLGKAIVQLIPMAGGSIKISGVDATALLKSDRAAFRRSVQMVFQDPVGSLDPRQRIGTIIETPLVIHKMGGRHSRREQVNQLMEQVGLRPELASRYPHELSGGQRQRVGIARALALDPKLIVCDEVVSALDVSVQAQVLNILRRLARQRQISYLFISHDLAVVAHMSDRVAVMYLGRVVETSTSRQLQTPAHPYTQALVQAVPKIAADPNQVMNKDLVSGDLPSPFAPPAGCPFHPRCPHATDLCSELPPILAEIAPEHAVACHLYNR